MTFRKEMKYEKFLTSTDKIVGCVAKFFGVFDARKAEMKNEGFRIRNPLFIQ